MLHGRNTWTQRALRLLGLGDVQVVVEGEGQPVAVVPVPSARPYRPMWRLGDWPVF